MQQFSALNQSCVPKSLFVCLACMWSTDTYAQGYESLQQDGVEDFKPVTEFISSEIQDFQPHFPCIHPAWAAIIVHVVILTLCNINIVKWGYF